MDDVPVTLLAAQLGLELLGGISGCGSRCGGEGVGGLVVAVVCGVGFFAGDVVSIGAGVVGFGREGLNLGLFTGFCRDVLGLFQPRLGYLELLLRHLVSCFLIA
ncbi:hypothetical protein QF050_001960 [Arthrobacter sp. SLBN-112]|nr:hypothetical protein [Arthrobacter sp. SLBN-112]